MDVAPRGAHAIWMGGQDFSRCRRWSHSLEIVVSAYRFSTVHLDATVWSLTNPFHSYGGSRVIQ